MSADERLAAMTPDELVAVIERGLKADEEAAQVAAATNAGSVATRWSAERVDHLSGSGLRGRAWAVVPERVDGVTIAISPTDIQPRFVAHIARHDPSRVLADVAAKREAVRLYRDTLDTIQMLTDHGHDGKAHRVAAESYLNILRARPPLPRPGDTVTKPGTRGQSWTPGDPKPPTQSEPPKPPPPKGKES